MRAVFRRFFETFFAAFGGERLPDEPASRRRHRALARFLLQPLGGSLIALLQVGALAALALSNAGEGTLEAARSHVLIAAAAAHGLWIGIATKSLLRAIVGMNAGMVAGVLFYWSMEGATAARRFDTEDAVAFLLLGAGFGLALGLCGRSTVAAVTGAVGGLVAGWMFALLAVVSGKFVRPWWVEQVADDPAMLAYQAALIAGTGWLLSWALLSAVRAGERLGEGKRERRSAEPPP